jgi:sigma-B regulation protein RsbU (phosphoserine phosphatase)
MEDLSTVLERSLECLLDRFEDELGFEGGRIYRREGEDFLLYRGFGSSRGAPVGLRVPRDYPPHLRCLAEGLVLMDRCTPGVDDAFEDAIGVPRTFAAIAVGVGPSHVVAFSIKGRVRAEQILYSLTAVRHALNLKLQQLRVTGIIEESRLIQESMLPSSPPEFEGYEIDGRTIPADLVSGDLFDYLPVSSETLGLAIADSSGHGLPAALLGRDVVTGLRMVSGSDAPIGPTIERLNRIVHRAALSSKFVSLFYGQLHRDGRLEYCNAGHSPPLLIHGRSVRQLTRGGSVLGPIASGRYESARVLIAAGGRLVMYTDGVVEREGPDQEPFGLERLRALLAETAGASARRTVDAVLSAAIEHGCGSPIGDDMTVVVVRRLGPTRNSRPIEERVRARRGVAGSGASGLLRRGGRPPGTAPAR